VLLLSIGFLIGAFLADTKNSLYSVALLALSWPLYLAVKPAQSVRGEGKG
jgi:hypothetical protein